jgi:outer membrane murein-binding lipoprotein Lpp
MGLILRRISSIALGALLIAGCANASETEGLRTRVSDLEDQVATLQKALRDQKFVDEVARGAAQSAQRAATAARTAADEADAKASDAMNLAERWRSKNSSVCNGVSLYAHYYGNGAPADFAGWYQEFGC